MHAVVNTDDGIRTIQVDEPGGAGVRLSVAAAGICGTDVQLAGYGMTGFVYGHEFAGVDDILGIVQDDGVGVPAAARLVGLVRGALDAWRAAPAWLGWAAAAQTGLVAAALVALRLSWPVADYHALSAAARPRDANVVVAFRPQTSEAAFRGGLRSVDARLVDGPTVADAYLVHVPPARRARALTALRANPDVSLAEAVDGEGSP